MDSFLTNPISFASSAAVANLSIHRYVDIRSRDYTSSPQSITYPLSGNPVFVYARAAIQYGASGQFVQLLPEEFVTVLGVPSYLFAITWNFASKQLATNTQINGGSGNGNTGVYTTFDYIVFSD